MQLVRQALHQEAKVVAARIQFLLCLGSITTKEEVDFLQEVIMGLSRLLERLGEAS